ncbi:uncharacterized protein LOC132183001 [Corylus avellana]|uniref:uncharacterized protein LOC132183001 n=1 Tax=Corylus avellana TaxID=13451 RepID=UPI00286A71FE|nr:uncharacterized protein LOC132183001 [Corylus avellana]
MKNKASAILKQIISTLSSMAKAKSLSLKSKTRAIKTRLIILSLLSKKKFLMSSLSHSIQQKKSSISHKLHTLLGHQYHDKQYSDDENQSKLAIALYEGNINAMTHESLPDQTRTELLEETEHGCVDEADEEDDVKYPDLTHSFFEDPGLGGSVIDLVKTSKEGAGEEFSLEDDIDHVADLFIKRFHSQMLMQKQLSLKRYHQMLQRGA